MPGMSARGQDVPHLSITQPGGMPGRPVVTGITRITNGVSVTWDGTPGSYGNCQLFKKSSLSDPKWLAVGSPTLSGKATVSPASGNAFLRVSGPSPQYTGAQTCLDCHGDTYSVQTKTPHAGAFTNVTITMFTNVTTKARQTNDFKAQGGQTNKLCLACHTVGYGLPTGFVITSPPSPLAGVQCENCHGAAGNHAASEIDPTVRPRVELAATVCGGCHTTNSVPTNSVPLGSFPTHFPRYEEWNTSGHRAVRAELQADFAGVNGTNDIPRCGRCHSGTVREALMENNPLPYGREAGAVGIACATCHDPHQVNIYMNVFNGPMTNLLTGAIITNHQLGAVYTKQLRNPLASTNDYHTAGFITTNYYKEFATNYNAGINICGQCHNDQGASTNEVSRPPHRSLQYNMLLGTVGDLNTGLPPHEPATHALLEKQCVSCHMQKTNYVNGAQASVSGHTFVMDTHATTMNTYDFCGGCHGGSVNASNAVKFTTMSFTNKIQEVKGWLDFWATTKAPSPLRTKYGVRAWEYTNPGLISNPVGVTNAGPSVAEQALIPANIQKARFNLYLVLYDGSYGVHNPPHAINLLDTALDCIQGELKK